MHHQHESMILVNETDDVGLSSPQPYSAQAIPTHATATTAGPAQRPSAYSSCNWWKQLTLVVYKCWLSKRRAPLAALFELLAPVMVVLVLVAVRPSVVDEHDYMPPQIHRIYSSIDAGPFAMMESVCCEGRPDISDLPNGTTFDRGPIIQVATQLSAVLTPSTVTALFCETVKEIVLHTALSLPPELDLICNMATTTSSSSSQSPRSKPTATSWVTRLATCVQQFQATRNASAQSARYKAPLAMVDCLNTVSPIVIRGTQSMRSITNLTQLFNRAAARVFGNSSGNALQVLSDVSSMLHAALGIGDHAQGWALNGDHIDYFSESLALKRLVDNNEVDDAIAGVCSPFCPAKRKTVHGERNYNGWLDGWESRGNKNDTGRPEYLGPETGDGLGTVKGLRSIFGRLQYFYSPDTVATRAIIDAALAPYNDLALMLRGLSSVLSLSSIAPYSPGQRNVGLEEVWWCSDAEVSTYAASSASGLLVAAESIIKNRDAADSDDDAAQWTLAHTGPLAFKANSFRKNSLRRITADLVAPPSLGLDDKNATTKTTTTTAGTHTTTVARIVFKASGECVDWTNCAAPGGLCECNTTIRYLHRKGDDAIDSSYSDRHGHDIPSEVLCTHEHLAALSSAPLVAAKPEILLCQCAAEHTCKATVQFGRADQHPLDLATVLEWDSKTQSSTNSSVNLSNNNDDDGDGHDNADGDGKAAMSTSLVSPSTHATSDYIKLQAGIQYRFVLTYFNTAQGDNFELTAAAGDGRELSLISMLQFPELTRSVRSTTVDDDAQRELWMLPSIPALSSQFPSLIPKATGFDSKEALIDALGQNWVDARGVHFDFANTTMLDPSAAASSSSSSSSSSTFDNLKYSVHYSPDIDIPSTHTKGLRPVYNVWGTLTWANYIKSGVTTLIQSVDRAILTLEKERLASSTTTTTKTLSSSWSSPPLSPSPEEPVLIQSLPTPGYHSGFFLYNCRLFVPLVLVLAFIYPVSVLVKSVVSEKELRLKESMKMWGLSDEMNWLGWFLVSLASAEITVTILVVLLKFGKIFEHSSFGILFLFFSLVALATICLSFLFSVMFSKARVAASSSGLIYFLLYLPATVINARRETVSSATKRAASLMAPTSFGLGCTAIADWELMMVGVNSENFNEKLSVDLSLNDICTMLFLDSIIYILIAWYVDKVWPGEFGQGLHPLFFLPERFKRWVLTVLSGQEVDMLVASHDDGDCGGDGGDGGDGSNGGDGDVGDAVNYSDNGSGNAPAQQHPPPVVVIKRLSKVYGNPSAINKRVLNNINLKLEHGQLTTLLGSNGAGKTTLINVLTGLIPPTSGVLLIDGLDMTNPVHASAIHQRMGVCPQGNHLFDFLTVIEHVYLVHALRSSGGGDSDGTSAGSNKSDYKLLEEVGLTEKKDTLASNLSGGQKRKLCLLLAFVGNPTLVVLDEPTAGVDPDSRRLIWEMILKHRREQTVLLCTHHMDEADVLSDRLAFIREGQIRCTGTVEELKRKFGKGSIMTIQLSQDSHQRSPPTFNQPPLQQQRQHHRQTPQQPQHPPQQRELDTAIKRKSILLELIKRHVPNAYAMESESSNELKVKLADATSSQTAGLLAWIRTASKVDNRTSIVDGGGNNLGIETLGLSAPTLKDVFIALTDGDAVMAQAQSTTAAPLEVVKHSDDTKSRNINTTCSANGAQEANPQEPTIVDAATTPVDASILKRRATGWQLTHMQMRGLLRRRFLHSTRDLRAMFAQFVLPVIFVLIAMLIATSLPPIGPEPELVLKSTVVYQEPVVIPVQDACTATTAAATPPPPLTSTPTLMTTPTEALYSRINVAADGRSRTDFATFASNVESNSFAGSFIESRQPCSNFTDFLYATTQNGNGDVAFRRIPRSVAPAPNQIDPDISLSRLLTADASVVEPVYAKVAMWESRNYHGLPVVLSRAADSRRQAYNLTVTASLNPIEHRLDLSAMQYLKSGIDIVVTVFILLALSFIPASVVLQLVQNKATGLTHLQMTSGLPPLVFWVANFVFDFAIYTASTLLVLLCISAFDLPAFSGVENKVAATLLMWMYGWATIPLMYVLSSKFSVPTTAYIGTLMGTLMCGITTTLTYFVLNVFVDDEEGSLVATKNVMKVLFLIFPSFGLGRGLLDITETEYEARGSDAMAALLRQPLPERPAVLSWNILGQVVFALAVEGFVFFAWRVRQDTQRDNKPAVVATRSHQTAEVMHISKDGSGSDDDGGFELLETGLAWGSDVDVHGNGSEETCAGKRVNVDADAAAAADSDADDRCDHELLDAPHPYVQVNNVTHRYPTKPSAAVDRVSFEAGRGQVFGLLGVNGAGKTTLFKIMTSAMSPTEGTVQVMGCDTVQQKAETRRNFGYCPQSVECLFPNLTGQEHLAFFAELRGIRSSDLNGLSSKLFQFLGLEKWQSKRVCTYSGGNKRKLSVAIALLSQPPVLFLDEPTAGVDPLARRNLWNQIKLLSGNGCCVIVTSHSIEECESLCERLCIMVDGGIAAMGTPQQLQQEYGDGYTLVVDVEEAFVPAAKRFIATHFSGSKVLDAYKGRLRYSLPCGSVDDVCKTFAALDSNKAKLHILDFTLSQATLESAFCSVVGGTQKGGVRASCN